MQQNNSNIQMYMNRRLLKLDGPQLVFWASR